MTETERRQNRNKVRSAFQSSHGRELSEQELRTRTGLSAVALSQALAGLAARGELESSARGTVGAKSVYRLCSRVKTTSFCG
jgi:hypothetical protein